MKPQVHANNSAKLFGGNPSDYLEIHQFLDTSKSVMPDNRHRALTHNTWFLSNVLEKVFGVTRVNSEGKSYSVRDVGEQHILEDFGNRFIPSAQDFLQEIEYKPWMNNGSGVPSSFQKIENRKITRQQWSFD